MRCNPPPRVAARLGQVDLLASAAGSVLSSILGGGTDKNAIRDQQEAQRYQQASGGDVNAAQGIYHDSLPQNKQTAERIKDDQMYWSRLMAAGWTVDGSGTVHPPSAVQKVINSVTTGQPAGAPLAVTPTGALAMTAPPASTHGISTGVAVVGGIAVALGVGLLLSRRPAA